jgi:putative phosphoribosyl transferase
MHGNFFNRSEAGRLLAVKLAKYAARPEVLVLALPRGGVPVGFEVVAALRVPMDVLVVRKLGVPDDEELAMGAVASGGLRVLNTTVLSMAKTADRSIATVAARERHELERREKLYRLGHPAPLLHGRTVILVDDGIATGSTMRVAVAAVRSQHAYRVVVATPVAARSSYLELRAAADEMVTILMPKEFTSVGQFYTDFAQTTDREVITLLTRARQNRWREETIALPAGQLV